MSLFSSSCRRSRLSASSTSISSTILRVRPSTRYSFVRRMYNTRPRSSTSSKKLSQIWLKLLSFDLFKMFFYFLIHRQPMLPIAKQFFDHFPIGRSPSVLILFGHLNACTAIPSPDVLHEVGTITDRLTLQCEDKWARPQVEAIGTADL